MLGSALGAQRLPAGRHLELFETSFRLTRLNQMETDRVSCKTSILVVEDETLIRLWAADLLEENGFSVLEAKDAEAALRVLESRPDVKLVFTDVHMPGCLDGMDLAREVHARWPHILLVITSGRERPTPADIPDDGRFVAKPYDAEELLGQVNDLLHQ
jgi:two-component system, response regulator PdtaR